MDASPAKEGKAARRDKYFAKTDYFFIFPPAYGIMMIKMIRRCRATE
jgi:hypothetical protein